MTLVRNKRDTVDYYKVAVYRTLFDDFMLVHHCGQKYSRRSKRSFFKTKKEALLGSLNVITDKQNEGYQRLA